MGEDVRAIAAHALRAVMALEREGKSVAPFAAAMIREFEGPADWSDDDIIRLVAKIERLS